MSRIHGYAVVKRIVPSFHSQVVVLSFIFVSQAQITSIPSTVTKVWNRGIGYIQDVLKRDEDR
jgi:hypothetical protein